MSTSRRFLVASSLARLIQNERECIRIVEGYFPDRDGRTSCVRLEESAGFLVLKTTGPRGLAEECVEVPRAHAEALLDVTAGEVDYVHSRLLAGTREIHVNRFISPGPLDLISIKFESEQEARSFSPLPWFGPEITADRRYRHQAIAFGGLPELLEIPFSNAVLHSLVDTLENRSPAARQQPRPSAGGGKDQQPAERSAKMEPLLRAEARLEEDSASLEEPLPYGSVWASASQRRL